MSQRLAHSSTENFRGTFSPFRRRPSRTRPEARVLEAHLPWQCATVLEATPLLPSAPPQVQARSPRTSGTRLKDQAPRVSLLVPKRPCSLLAA
ncbi:hypothetical protein OH77DRAFT_1041248 [Trametes cingulata]|nr:hypothetical protein OH77DRAFT_1041248 [Trametes cingulata]